MCSSFWFSRWHSITLLSSEVMQLSMLCLTGGPCNEVGTLNICAHPTWGILANFEHKWWPRDREVWTMQKKCWPQVSGSLNNAKMTKATRVLNTGNLRPVHTREMLLEHAPEQVFQPVHTKDTMRKLNDETTTWGYVNWLLYIQHGSEQLWIEKEKHGSFNELFLISSIVIVFLNLTNIGENTSFSATWFS